MAQVEIRLNGRTYKITCENGQEERLTQLAGYFSRHVSALKEDLGQIGDARLMLLAGLTICDELFELKGKQSAQEQDKTPLDAESLAGACRVIEAATERVDAISRRLEVTGY